MKGRITMMRIMPSLNLLVKYQLISTTALDDLLQTYLPQKSLDVPALIMDLYNLDIPDDKAVLFSSIVDQIEANTKEESHGKNQFVG